METSNERRHQMSQQDLAIQKLIKLTTSGALEWKNADGPLYCEYEGFTLRCCTDPNELAVIDKDGYTIYVFGNGQEAIGKLVDAIFRNFPKIKPFFKALGVE